MVVPKNGYRVNVIGFRKQGILNECGIQIHKNDIQKPFSVDKSGHVYRVEIYKDQKFSGTVLVNFNDGPEMISSSSPSQILFLQDYTGR